MDWWTRNSAAAVVIGVGVIVIAVALIGVVAGYLNNASRPIQVQLHYPTPHPVTPTPTPGPTPTPVPTPSPITHNAARLAQHYDQEPYPYVATSGYQGGPHAFTAGEFTTAGTPHNNGWDLHVPNCDHLSGFPWTRYSVAWPQPTPVPVPPGTPTPVPIPVGPNEVLIDGFNARGAMVLEDELIDIGGNPYALLINIRLWNCQLAENDIWEVE